MLLLLGNLLSVRWVGDYLCSFVQTYATVTTFPLPLSYRPARQVLAPAPPPRHYRHCPHSGFWFLSALPHLHCLQIVPNMLSVQVLVCSPDRSIHSVNIFTLLALFLSSFFKSCICCACFINTVLLILSTPAFGVCNQAMRQCIPWLYNGPVLSSLLHCP